MSEAGARDEPQSWPVASTERVYDGPGPFGLRLDELTTPGHEDETFRRLVLEHPGAVVVLAVDDEERVLVLRQYRHPVGRRLIELPAGLLDVDGEDALVTARRELREEALLIADEWTHLFTTYSSPGISSERIAYFVARGLSPAPDRGGFELAHEEADMTLLWMPFDELLEAVRDGRAGDGPAAQAALGYAQFVRGSAAHRGGS